MYRLNCLVLLFALSPVSICLAGAAPAPGIPPVVKVGFYEFPPSIYTDADGKAKGPAASLVRRMLARAGYRAQFRSLPSARLYNGLIDGSVHLWAGATGKPALRDHTIETRRTLSEVTMNLYFRPDTPPPKIPEGLTKRDVILISGYSYWPSVSQLLDDPQLAINTHSTSTHTAALEMLQRRRGDFIIDYQIPVNEARKELGMGELPFVVLERMPIKFIISRKAPNPEALRDALDRAYDQMQAAGEDLSLP
jgi:polar amino acid transport system substrate-binding protein